MNAETEFNRIDCIVSTNEMIRAVQALNENLKKEVIFLGLKRSKHQFHWSYIADKFGIPEKDWPNQE